ncbi:hypothetical protein, partial [Streptosporangium sp. NPDC049644]|uniref:hypothetical protein n=1 Tax=Streptosporangium sp. NPDC049644 TaxID=3155507 RepID=UPI0034186642
MAVVDSGDAAVPGGDVEGAGGADQDSSEVNPGLLARRDVRPDQVTGLEAVVQFAPWPDKTG